MGIQWDDERLLACAHGKLSMTGDMTIVRQTTPLDKSNTGLYAQLTTLTPPSLPQEHLKCLQQAGTDATWIPDSVEHSSLYGDNVLKLAGGSWVSELCARCVQHQHQVQQAKHASGSRSVQTAIHCANCHLLYGDRPKKDLDTRAFEALLPVWSGQVLLLLPDCCNCCLLCLTPK